MLPVVFVLASSISDLDANAAIMFVQSKITPAIFEVCKQSMPARATEFDSVRFRWDTRNKELVKRGARVAREQMAREGKADDSELATERDSMVDILNTMSLSERIERCEHILDVVRSES